MSLNFRPQTAQVRDTMPSSSLARLWSSMILTQVASSSASCHSMPLSLSLAMIRLGTATRFSGEKFRVSWSANMTQHPSGTGSPCARSHIQRCFSSQLSLVPRALGRSRTLTKT